MSQTFLKSRLYSLPPLHWMVSNWTMWKGLLITLVFGLLTVSSLPTETIKADQDAESQTLVSGSELDDREDEEDSDDALNEVPETSNLGLFERSFENYDGDIFEMSPQNTSDYGDLRNHDPHNEEDRKEERRVEDNQNMAYEVSSRPHDKYHPPKHFREPYSAAELSEGVREFKYAVSQPSGVGEERQPVFEPLISPERAYTVSYDSHRTEPPSAYDNRLLYRPESGENDHQEASQSQEPMYNAHLKPVSTAANSYEKRKNQVDEYWREEERQKAMYERQNTYRRSSVSERADSWDQGDCTYDSMGRPINCPPKASNSYNTYDAISMKVRSSPALSYPLSSNESAVNAEVDTTKAEADADHSAFLRANRVHLSAPRWPVRNMDSLGYYPRHPACRLPPEWGAGPEERSAWFYSQPDGRCLWFSYNGHGGNANRFYSRANCESLCVFDQSDLCQNSRCGYPGSYCMLRGDERCKAYAKSRGKSLDTECPPDQPVCRARRAIIPPEYNTELIPSECREQVDMGGCLVKNPEIRYHYDVRSNTCRAFYFHGCGGNSNRFESMQECMNHCAL
ncbi:Papilin [Taenia crassiceps]|uniref:Papilin n=1 Tax=Taenia crassiceps TaxID=6207 RepID=A0ABR4Q1L3_9CEST